MRSGLAARTSAVTTSAACALSSGSPHPSTGSTASTLRGAADSPPPACFIQACCEMIAGGETRRRQEGDMGLRSFVGAAISISLGGALALPAGASAAHAPIAILSDSDFASCGCVSSGSGTPAHPYVVGPLSVNNASGTAVLVDGTTLTKSFVLSN